MTSEYAARDPKRRLILQELGFQEEPFTRAADPRFLYLSSGHGRILNGVQDVIELRRGLAVVEGAYGLGKSSIGRRLESIYRLQDQVYMVVYLYSSGYESEFAALNDICYALKLEPRRGLTKQWREFETYLVDQTQKGRNVVIIIDDAQQMTAGALTFVHKIYNFESIRIGKLAQVILLGQPEIRRIFDERPEVASRVDVWYKMNELTLEETFGLVTFRASVSGRKEPFLTRTALVTLWEGSRGVPRSIVSICSTAVDLMGESGKAVADDEIIKQAVAIHFETRIPQSARNEVDAR